MVRFISELHLLWYSTLKKILVEQEKGIERLFYINVDENIHTHTDWWLIFFLNTREYF